MNDKIRIPVYLPAVLDEEVKLFCDGGYAKSRNDFINRAIEFYIGYLRSDGNVDYVAPILASVIKSQMQSVERNVSEIIFKLAVEVAKQNHLTASRMNLSEEQLERLNDMCCRDVASNNGRVQFEDAYDYQHNQYDEDEDGEDGDY